MAFLHGTITVRRANNPGPQIQLSDENLVERIRRRLNLTSLRFQRLEDLVWAIGLPKDRLCTYCWDGVEVKSPSLPFA